MSQLIRLCVAGLCLLPLWAGAVDINNADAETLSRELKGVGSAKAQAIVAYRERNGGFQAPEELLNVRGIGIQILDANRDQIELGAQAQ